MNQSRYDQNFWEEDGTPRRRRQGGPLGRHGHQPFGPGLSGGGPFGPGGPFGANGPFGPGGPFGRGGPFGAGGPMGPMGPGGRGRGRRGHVRSSILALLAEAPLNGYQIMQTLAERTEGAWKPSPGAVYPALSQLEDEGLIESFDNEGQKAFRLTDTGRQAAEEVTTKPWDVINDAVADLTPDQMRAMWKEFTTLAGALKELTRSGNAQHLEAATKLLAETRRKLYALLAAEEDLPNADDLR